MDAYLGACAYIMLMRQDILHVKRASSASPFLGMQGPLSDCFIMHLYSYFTCHVIHTHTHMHAGVYHVLAHVCAACKLGEAACSAAGLLYMCRYATRSKSGGLRLLHFIYTRL